MGLEARVQVVGDIYFVELVGKIGFDVVDHFRKICLQKWAHQKLVFDLKNLSFVGSHGISDFVSALEELSLKDKTLVKFCGVSSEFRRIFQVSRIQNLEMYDNVERALHAFSTSSVPQDIL